MAINESILIPKGATWEKEYALVDQAGDPFDLTGWTISGGIKYDYDDGANAASFTVTVTTATAGEFTISLTSTITDGLTAPEFLNGPPVGVYTLDMTDGTKVVRLAEGKVQVNPSI